MPIERLPYTPISYPVLNYPVIPLPPVVPWAAYMAQIADQLAQAGKDLSPAERQRKATELAILGAQMTHINLANDYQQMVNQGAKTNAGTYQNSNGSVNDKLRNINNWDNQSGKIPVQTGPAANPANLNLGDINSPNVPNPIANLNEPDTSLASYNGHADPGTTLGVPEAVDQNLNEQAQQGVATGSDVSLFPDLSSTEVPESPDSGALAALTAPAPYYPE